VSLMAEAIAVGYSTWVSLDVYRAGAQSMRSYGKSQVRSYGRGSLVLAVSAPTVRRAGQRGLTWAVRPQGGTT